MVSTSKEINPDVQESGNPSDPKTLSEEIRPEFQSMDHLVTKGGLRILSSVFKPENLKVSRRKAKILAVPFMGRSGLENYRIIINRSNELVGIIPVSEWEEQDRRFPRFQEKLFNDIESVIGRRFNRFKNPKIAIL